MYTWDTHGPTFTAREGAEARLPPSPRATVELLRRKGHKVAVRENRTGSLRYAIDGGRELTALEAANRLEQLNRQITQ